MDLLHPKLEKILIALPVTPGVYKMKDTEGKIIYIGKAKNLRNRVKSYFLRTAELGPRKEGMIDLIDDIEYIEVGSDLEAIMLETNLIKQFRPKYNVAMKDDKNYVYIRVSVHEDFPRVTIVRKREHDKARYFGPKTAAHKVKQMLDILRKVLPFRHCGLNIKYIKPNGSEHDVEVTNKVIKYPCLYHFIRRCAAPCIGKIDTQNYGNIINKVINFLEGKPEELMNQLRDEMQTYASQKKFEKAAATRDKLKTMEEMFEKQRISDPSRKDTDVFHFITDNSRIYSNLFQIRDGRIIGQENFMLQTQTEKDTPSTSEICQAFIRDYYEKATSIPEEILIPELLNEDEKELIEAWLSQKKGKKVTMLWPQLGEKNKLLELSLANARSYAHQQKAKWMKEEIIPKESLTSLAEILKLPKPPKRIECYDISHFGGTGTVASMVVLSNGQPENSEYRRFKLRTIPEGKPDDYASMREVLSRRLKYIQADQYRYATASKKNFTEIQKIIEDEKKKNTLGDENLNQKDFLCLMDNKNCIGFVRAIDIEKNSGVLRSLWIKADYQGKKLGYSLIYQLMKKRGFKKYYIWIDKNLEEYYQNFGFQQIESAPENFWKAYPEDAKDDQKKNDGKEIMMMIETAKLLAQYRKFTIKPDLIILDGGKGQLGVGVEVLKELNLNIPICSLAKQEEEIFVPNQKESIKLPKDSKTLHLMQTIRDESHRFAVTYANFTHNKSLITSELDDLPGLGELTKKKLLKHFGSLASIKNATMDELARVAGKKTAMMLKQQLQK